MNKITLGFFLAKSKTTIKGLLVLFALLLMNTQVSWGQVNITPIRTDVSGFATWTDTGLAGTTYLQLLTATSQTISPAMDFDGYTGETLNFKARTFGTITPGEHVITVWISIDNGSNWTSLGTRTPANSTPTAQSAFDVSSYNGTQVKIKFTVGGTSNTIGVGIDDISITGIVFSSGPEINMKGNTVSIVDGSTPASTTNGTDFGTVATNTNVTKTYTIENTGSADLVLTVPYVQKSLATTVFSITQPALTTIPTGGSTTFSVTFNSASAGTFDEVIEVLSNDTDEATYNFAIKTIAEVPVPNIVVKGNSTIILVGDATPSTTDSTDFGSTAISTNVIKTYTIENNGTGDLTVNNILMANDPTSKYIIGGISFPSTIAASSSTTFTVTFNSAVAGTFTDTVLIDNNDPTDSTYDFAVTAKAAVLNFGVGDISITALANDAPDGISFVNWVPIPIDAELYFTDNAYEAGVLKTNEGGSLLWKNNTGSVVPVGTVIYISTLTTSSTDLGSVTGALDGLSASGENLFIYEGSAVIPNFIYGLSNLDWITTGTATTNNSYLPTELNVTNGNIVTGDSDNVEYSGVLALKDEKSSFSAYKTLVNDPANWIKNNTPFALNSIDFELAAVWESAAWTDVLIPTPSLKTIIKDTYTTAANGVFSAKKLTVTSLGSLTINTGTNLTVVNEVINNAGATGIVIENNANLIQDAATVVNANTGAVTVNRTSKQLFRLDYTLWSSPVSGTQTLGGFSPLTTVGRFYMYNSGSNQYNVVAPETIFSPTTPFSQAKGYLIRMPNEGSGNYNAGTETLEYPGVFIGTPNNGTVSVTGLTSDSYNAVGNPYPSTLDAAAFLTGNNTDGVLYFWRKTNGIANTTSSYATWTTLGAAGSTIAPNNIAPDGTIAVGQGFIVKTGVGITALNFTNAMRTSSNSAKFFKTKKVEEKSRVWLNLTNTAGAFSQVLVGYVDGATNGFDNGIDGKYINDSPIALTSNINNQEYTIQGRPTFDASDVVALNFKTDVAGDYTIAIDQVDGLFSGTQDIYLVDSKTGTETNLKTSSYTFTAAAAVDNTRFSLKFQKTLSLDAQELNDNSVIVYKNGGVIYVNSGAKTMNNIKVFDILGRVVAERNNVKANTASIQNLRASNQVLIVKVTTDDNQVISKKVEN